MLISHIFIHKILPHNKELAEGNQSDKLRKLTDRKLAYYVKLPSSNPQGEIVHNVYN